jgi:hypothetical protein
MNRTIARVIFLLPLLLVCGVIAWSVLDDRAAWPVASQEYLFWYRAQLPETKLLFNGIGSLGLFVFVLSTIGLVLFWSPARYAYVVSVVLLIGGDIPAIPVLASGPGYFLNQVSTLALGLTLGMLFLDPVAQLFQRAFAQQGAPGDGPRPTGSARP